MWQCNAEQINTGAVDNVKNIDNLAANLIERGQGEVRHLIAQHIVDLTHLLGELGTQSRKFH